MASLSTTEPIKGSTTLVQLHISCSGLKKSEVFRHAPNPVVAIFSPPWGPEVARTELIKNDENPQFTEVIQMEYRFKETQKLRFAVYDVEDEKVATLYYDDFYGDMGCFLQEIVQAGKYTKGLDGKKGSKVQGTITISAEEVCKDQQLLEMKFSAHGLDKKDFLGKSDPFLEFARKNPDGSFTAVHRTMVIKNTLNPSWPVVSVTTGVLCSNQPDRMIRVRCYDWDTDSSNDLIGEFYTTFADLVAAASGSAKLEWEAINPTKQVKKKDYKNSGTVCMESIKITKIYSFLDYVTGGCHINFTVGIDFSTSNGSRHVADSLHHIAPGLPNQYIQVLKAVGSSIQVYGTDKLVPVFGFGGKFADDTKVSHMFALNGNPENPCCTGIDGIIEAYKSAVKAVQLSQPTCVAPLINHVASLAEQAMQHDPNTQQYFVLVMLTAGVFSDMKMTKFALIKASDLPMSVIIVGVGSFDMEHMMQLDSDQELLRIGDSVAVRDIVHFVPYCNTGGFRFVSEEEFASAILAELPQQLTEYMTRKGIKPLGK